MTLVSGDENTAPVLIHLEVMAMATTVTEQIRVGTLDDLRDQGCVVVTGGVSVSSENVSLYVQ